MQTYADECLRQIHRERQRREADIQADREARADVERRVVIADNATAAADQRAASAAREADER